MSTIATTRSPQSLATSLQSLFRIHGRSRAAISVRPGILGLGRRTFTSLQQQQQPNDITPLYSFGGLSERDVLLLEMRHAYRVSWTDTCNLLGISPTDAFFAYIDVGSKAISQGWSPKMTTKDIEYYLSQSI